MDLKPRVEVWLSFGSGQARGRHGANLLLPLQQCHVCSFSLFSPFFFLSCVALQDRAASHGMGMGCTGGVLRRWGPTRALLHLGLCPFSASSKGRGPKERATGAMALLRQICSLTALAGSAPTTSAYWRYRWVLIMPSALAAIQMLKLFICSWASSRQRQRSRARAAPLHRGRPPAPISFTGCGSPSAGRDGSGRLCLGISVLGRTHCSPAPADVFLPHFPGETGAVCLAAKAWW